MHLNLYFHKISINLIMCECVYGLTVHQLESFFLINT